MTALEMYEATAAATADTVAYDLARLAVWSGEMSPSEFRALGY